MTETRMQGVSHNLGYLARGLRTYGRRPVLPRMRGAWELQWVLRGGARPFRADHAFPQGAAPRLYISHPASPHGWTDEGGRVAEVFVLHAGRVPEELAAWVKPAETRTIDLTERELRAQAARQEELWSLWTAGDARLGLKLEQMLVETALLVLERESPSPPPLSPLSRVERALHWFAENLGEHPDVGDVAAATGVSAAHLRRVFAEAGRASPRRELARLRMEAARRCLLEGWKLERVAEYLGFSEASAFSRAFAAETGCSPREWRKGAETGRGAGLRGAPRI